MNELKERLIIEVNNKLIVFCENFAFIDILQEFFTRLEKQTEIGT